MGRWRKLFALGTWTMSTFKTLKTLIRKCIFNPIGFDIIPLQRERKRPKKPSLKQSFEVDSDGNHLEQYVELFGEEAVMERRFYNLGAESSFKHPAWAVINHPSAHYGDDYMDIRWNLLSGKPLPIEDEKARVIFSRYTLEHVTDEAVGHFLHEAYRVLAKGGYLRLVVPDIDIFYLAYLAKMPDLFHRPKQDEENFPNEKFLANPNQASFEQRFLWTFASSASELHPDGALERISDAEFRSVFEELSYVDALSYCTSKCSLETQRRNPENHINWFNEKKLRQMLLNAGFQNVYRSGFGQSHCPVLREVKLFEAREPEIGLFMEAVK